MQNNLFLFHQRKMLQICGSGQSLFPEDEGEHPTLHQLKDFIPRYVIY